MIDQSQPEQAPIPAYFCEDCPFRGDAVSELEGIAAKRYRVGLYRVGASGVVFDADGNTSELMEMPFDTSGDKGGEAIEYWPELDADSEVATDAQIERIRKCTKPTVTSGRLGRTAVKCPAISPAKVKKSHRKTLRPILQADIEAGNAGN